MSRTFIPKLIREQIANEARQRCGYCLSQQDVLGIQLHIEHIIPESIGGSSESSNLWLSCSECNNHKGAQTHASDPETGEFVALFNPRTQVWSEHFRWSDDATEVIGITTIGRATVIALDLNQPLMVRARRRWVMVGWHPPTD